MEDDGRRVGYAVKPVSVHDEEQETPCQPDGGTPCYITFMSFNRQIQEFNKCIVPSMSAGQEILVIL